MAFWSPELGLDSKTHMSFDRLGNNYSNGLITEFPGYLVVAFTLREAWLTLPPTGPAQAQSSEMIPAQYTGAVTRRSYSMFPFLIA